MKRAWLAWVGFALSAGAMVVVMAWGMRKLINYDRAERDARREAALEESVRLSLWRMETMLAPVIVQENSRPLSVDPARDAEGAPASAYVRERFDWDAQRQPPPQVAALRDLAERAAVLAAIPENWIHAEEANARPAPAAETQPRAAVEAPPQSQSQFALQSQLQQPSQAQFPTQLQVPLSQNAPSQVARNVQEFDARSLLNRANAVPLLPAPARQTIPIRASALAPVWAGGELLLARRARIGTRDVVQVAVLDWPKVRGALLAGIEDLLPGSDLTPQRGPFNPAEGRNLTSLPLRLVPGRAPLAADEASPLIFSLKVAWACMAIAILAVGLLLMGALSLSQRRAAFVSAVTHELRSPLTTFRLYTEMLVEGMAADPAQQSQYHQTLYRESGRLVHLVENVLSYARLERGRYGQRELVSLGDFIGRISSRLEEHARAAGREFEVGMEAAAGGAMVKVDTSAVERVLFNLVDNACKHARPASDPRIHLEVSVEGRRARLTVRDHGPGIERRKLRRFFRPFSRTVSEAARSAPGVGIGLSLSRRLARAERGRLIVDAVNEGACVTLELPLAQRV